MEIQRQREFIFESYNFFQQLLDKTFEVSQLQATIADYQRHINETESKYKCDIAKLKNKNQELKFAFEDVQKERLGVTPKVQTSSQAASCNGDFLSEAGSLIQDDAGDLSGFSQPTISLVCKQVALAIIGHRGQWIKMSASDSEQNSVIADFHAICGFRQVIGTIDCTHIRIPKISGNIGHT